MFDTPELSSAVYLLCFVTSTTCGWLLLRAWLQSRTQMLFWSACCFLLLALNNLIVVLDIIVVPGIDLSLWRLVASLAAVGVLMFGFIWRGEER